MVKPRCSVKVGEGHLVAFMFSNSTDNEIRVALCLLPSLDTIPDVLAANIGVTVLESFDYGKYSIIEHEDEVCNYVKAFDIDGNEVFRRVVKFSGVIS